MLGIALVNGINRGEIMLKKAIKKIKDTISNKNFKLEVVFFIGVLFIVYTNFKINKYFGMYSIGALLISYSIYSLKS